ncbi:amino acid ABC transporter permease [Corynebacterium sp.]|uniref:amino acid ABC transporter permease n=1 Tax=Corynebacterium sp. TaxID=1720 RepID=UPI0026DEDD50|nr:amino acid ABC transporter permease [Corynebacterium sp.]MDO5511330.1 amino acid ABC transporter permease [Corynebacterium sp.]
MSVRATVLYDAPGPRGRRNNLIFTALTAVVTIAVLGWIGWTLGNNGQLEASKWTPFLDSLTWQTYILPGLWGTLKAAFASIILAMILGVVLGLGRLSEVAPIRWVCAVIVEFFRAIPVLLLMIFAYQLFAIYRMVPPSELAFAAVVFALTMYNGSVIAEILRSGIKSLPKGQTEAARALGMSHSQTMRTILLPQAIAAMLPALIAQMVIALKDSALGYQIGYIEVVRSGIQTASVNQNFLASLTVVAIIMILINWALTSLAQRVERQLRAGRARRNIVAKVPELPDQGLDTKDNVNVDWHDPDYVEIKNPGQ